MPESAYASVSTVTPDRYAKQLADHLGHRCEVVQEPKGTRLKLPHGDCLLSPSDGALELHANAPDEDALDRMMDLVGGHLERFGQRDELVVHWTRP